MNAVQVVGCCLYIWALTTVRCSSSRKCRAVAIHDDVTLGCNQETSSPERFVLWYYSNNSESGYESVASCYFDNVCNTTDHTQYFIENRSESSLARTTLTIKNVSAEHNGWTYQCYVWDAFEDILYLSEEYRLLVYMAPMMNCSYKRKDEIDAVIVKCLLKRVFPQNVSCSLQCESGEKQNLDVTVHLLTAQYNVMCEGFIRASFQDNRCKVTVLARGDEGSCEYILATSNDSFSFTRNSKYSMLHQNGYVSQGETYKNVYFSYIFPGAVAALVIPLSICTLFLVLRKRRRRPIPPVQFPLYEQANTSRELVSANSTSNCSWESVTSSPGEVAPGVHHNVASMCGDTKSNYCPDYPVTLPFLTAEVDAVGGVCSSEFAELAPPPAPHRQQQTVTLNRIVNEHKCRCYNPRQFTEMRKREHTYGSEQKVSVCEDTQVKKISGITSVGESCKFVESVFPDMRPIGSRRFYSRDVRRRDTGNGSRGFKLRYLCDVIDRRQANLQCSDTNNDVEEGACFLPGKYVCNRSCSARCEPGVHCRCCLKSEHSPSCESKDDQRRELYHRHMDDELQYRTRVQNCDGHDLLDDCTRHPGRCNCRINCNDDNSEIYIDPHTSSSSSAKSSTRQASSHCREQPGGCGCPLQANDDRPKLYIDPCSSGATSIESSSTQSITHISEGKC